MLSISMAIIWIPATTLFLGKKNTGFSGPELIKEIYYIASYL